MKPAIAQPTHVLDINRLAHLQPPTYIHTYICHARIPAIRRNYIKRTLSRSEKTTCQCPFKIPDSEVPHVHSLRIKRQSISRWNKIIITQQFTRVIELREITSPKYRIWRRIRFLKQAVYSKLFRTRTCKLQKLRGRTEDIRRQNIEMK